jgi:hypothetical protein
MCIAELDRARRLVSRISAPEAEAAVAVAQRYFDLAEALRSLNADVVPLRLKTLAPREIVAVALEQLPSAYLSADVAALDASVDEDVFAFPGRRDEALPAQGLVEAVAKISPDAVEARAGALLAVLQFAVRLDDVRPAFLVAKKTLPLLGEVSAATADSILSAVDVVLALVADQANYRAELVSLLLSHSPDLSRYASLPGAAEPDKREDAVLLETARARLLTLFGALLVDQGDSSLLLAPLASSREVVGSAASRGLAHDAVVCLTLVSDSDAVGELLESLTRDIQRKMRATAKLAPAAQQSDINEGFVTHLIGLGFSRNASIRAASTARTLEQVVARAFEVSGDPDANDPVAGNMAGALLVDTGGATTKLSNLAACLDVVHTVLERVCGRESPSSVPDEASAVRMEIELESCDTPPPVETDSENIPDVTSSSDDVKHEESCVQVISRVSDAVQGISLKTDATDALPSCGIATKGPSSTDIETLVAPVPGLFVQDIGENRGAAIDDLAPAHVETLSAEPPLPSAGDRPLVKKVSGDSAVHSLLSRVSTLAKLQSLIDVAEDFTGILALRGSSVSVTTDQLVAGEPEVLPLVRELLMALASLPDPSAYAFLPNLVLALPAPVLSSLDNVVSLSGAVIPSPHIEEPEALSPQETLLWQLAAYRLQVVLRTSENTEQLTGVCDQIFVDLVKLPTR